MAENSGTEHPDEPVDIQPENAPGEIDPAINVTTTNPHQQTANMEVHHHAHHEGKKSWKSYVWEFIMLFLAVFCGFLAEWQLEHTIEHSREKEFVVSMIKELESDNEKINGVFNDTLQINKLDSLVIALTNVDNNADNIKKAYMLKNNIGSLSAMAFNKSTISQLKNGGNMRLIRNRAVVDSINLIDNNIDYLAVQGATYDEFVLNNLQFISKVFDVRYAIKFKSAKIKSNYADYINQQSDIKYLSDDENLRIEFASQVAFQKSIFENYVYMLKHHQKLSKRMIVFLKKEYNIE